MGLPRPPCEDDDAEVTVAPEASSYGFPTHKFSIEAPNLSPISGKAPTIGNPTSIIVGFNSATTSSYENYSSHIGSFKKGTASSPLTDVLVYNQNSDCVDYHVKRSNYQSNVDSKSASAAQEKPCHGTSVDFFSSSPLPIPDTMIYPSRDANQDYICLETDGPLLTREQAWALHSPRRPTEASGLNHEDIKEAMLLRNTFPKKRPSKQGVSFGLSRSPLGPRFHSHINEAGSPDNFGYGELPQSVAVIHSAFVKGISEDIPGGRDDSYYDLSDYGYDDSVACKSSSSFGSSQSSPLKLSTSLNGLPVRRPLVGSFEESLFSGRFPTGKPCQKLDGFLALLSVTGGNWSPPVRKLPFVVTCVDGDNPLLYYATIDLAANANSGKCKGSKNSKNGLSEYTRAAKSRYRVPVRGRVQLVLSNPEMTPVHTFLCSYDLTDMPPGTKTFCRHKVSLAAPASGFSTGRGKSTGSSKAGERAGLHRIRKEAVYTGGVNDESKEDDDCSMGSSNHVFNELENLPVHCSLNDMLETAWNSSNKSVYKFGALNTSDIRTNSIVESGGSVLRYALHLRFVCPFVRKVQKVKSSLQADSVILPLITAPKDHDIDDERRIYLYNDLRVIFPQRRSDADEGKLQAEYNFPADPKYFEYSS